MSSPAELLIEVGQSNLDDNLLEALALTFCLFRATERESHDEELADAIRDQMNLVFERLNTAQLKFLKKLAGLLEEAEDDGSEEDNP